MIQDNILGIWDFLWIDIWKRGRKINKLKNIIIIIIIIII